MPALVDNPPEPLGESSSRKRKLAAILHADVVGFSRLMRADEAGTHQALRQLRAVVDPLIAKRGGRIVGTAGDSVLADFASVVDALDCAVDMQRAARAFNEPISPERRLALRIGVNLGDVIVDGDDIFGDGVNIAARLETLAQPGTVCISQSVYEQVRNKLNLDYRPLGSHRVKNIAEPIRAYAIGMPAAIPRRTLGTRRLIVGIAGTTLVIALVVALTLFTGKWRDLLGFGESPTGRPSVAVLPFENLSHDPSQDFFSNGTAEDVITALGRFSNLIVVAKSASFQFKDQNMAPAEIGRRLNVRYLLDGSVRRDGEHVRVNAELIEAATGRNVWAQAYDAELKDLFGVQEDIARRVVGAAAVKLTRFERDRAFGKPTKSLAAYEYVLRGRDVFSHATREGNHEAEDMFQHAIDLDPSYADAYAALGLSLVETVSSGWTEFIADDLGRAETLAQKALSIDSTCTTAHRLLAEVDMMKGQFDLALDAARRAIEINPNDAESIVALAETLVWAGRATEALPWLQDALRLDPTNARTNFLLGVAYYFLERYSEAVEAMSRGLAGNLGHTTQLQGRPVLAATYAELDRPQDAERERGVAMHQSPFFDAEQFAAQFGTQEAHDHMLEGLKKAGFR